MPGDLTPREVAKIFHVSVETVGDWARAGKITAWRTPGGARRYRRTEIDRLTGALPPEHPSPAWADDAVRLYQQGWSIRQVAAQFDTSYSHMRRVLRRHTTLRPR